MKEKNYVTYIITYNGEKMPKYYIGSTSLLNINNGYLGSIKSKRYKKIYYDEVKNNRNLFSIKILNRFNTRKEALIDEYNLHIKYDVVKSDDYINESIAAPNGYFGRNVNGENNPMFGRKNEIVSVNIETGEKCRISKEEFLNNPKLKGHTNGFLSVILIKTGEKIFIDKKQYNKDIHKHHNSGIKHSEDTKNKLSNIKKGTTTAKDWDGNCFRIKIDDERLLSGIIGGVTSDRWIIKSPDNIIYKTMNIKNFCKKYNLNKKLYKNIGWEFNKV